MTDSQFRAQASFVSAEQSDMNPSSTAFVGVCRTEAEVSVIDDMQFMDALLEHEASFVDSSEPLDPSRLSPLGNVPAVSESSNASSPTALQLQQVAGPQMGMSQQEVFPTYQPPVQPTQHYGESDPTQQNSKAPDGTMITPSVLTARLNYPFALVSSDTSFVAPAPVSCATGARKSAPTNMPPGCASTASSANRKRSRDTVPLPSEDEGDKIQRRIDRNQREQQRSQKITEQIACLKELLAAANVHFKPDKHSTLITVAEYIKRLQERSVLLDSEHQKLLDTITRTNDIANTPHRYQTTADETVVSNDLLSDDPMGLLLEDEQAVFVKGLDYRSIFKHCGIPLAVASIDGRIIDCNVEFESLTGYERDELLLCEVSKGVDLSSSAVSILSEAGVPSDVTTSPTRRLSLFNLLSRDDMENVFLAMSHMLRQPISVSGEPIDKPSSSSWLPRPHDFWSGRVSQSRRMSDKMAINVSLVRSPKGRPKFFQCSLIPCEPDSTSTRQ